MTGIGWLMAAGARREFTPRKCSIPTSPCARTRCGMSGLFRACVAGDLGPAQEGITTCTSPQIPGENEKPVDAEGSSLMNAPAKRPIEPNAAGAPGKATHAQLLIDQVLPTYDVGVVHADVFRAAPAECYRVASELDLFQTPAIRVLIGIRGLPPRAASILSRGKATRTPPTSRGTFRFRDMVDLGWISLGETLGTEMVLGQVGRPWKGVAVSTQVPTTREQFTTFNDPGFAKIATSIRVDPYGSDSSILTMETRVAITDDASRRRFMRYWLVIGPFSSLIRRMALRLLSTELHRSTSRRPDGRVG